MKRKAIWIILSCCIVLALILASCQQVEPTTTEEEGKTVTGKVEEGVIPEEKEEVEEEGPEMVMDPATHQMVTKPEYGGTLTFATASDVIYIDPYNGSAGANISSYFLEKLAMADWAVDRNVFTYKNTAFFPLSVYRGHIAESWEQVDPTFFIIHVRKGIRWQNLPPMNGRELTAYDVEWSYHRSLGLGSGFTTGNINDPTMVAIPWESVTATDKYTVEVRLKSPVLTALETFLCENYACSWIFPREVIEQYGDLNDWRNCVGSGPFIIKDHAVDTSWTFTKNPDYWCYDEKFPENKLPYVDEVRLLIIPDVQTRLAALRAGKIAYTSADLQIAKTLRQSNPELVEVTAFGSADAYPFDCTKPPFDDIRVRKAMQMAINTDEIVNSYYEGYGDPTPFSQLGDACIGYTIFYEDWEEEWKEGYQYNLDGAKKLMAEAGYPDGFKTTLNLFLAWVNADVAQIVKAYWQELDIELDIQTFEQAAYYSKLFTKTAGPIGSFFAASQYQPIGWLKIAYYGKSPFSFPINDAVYDAMVEEADKAATTEEQMQLIQDCEAYAIPKHWAIILPRPATFGFLQPWFKGWDMEFSLGGGTFGTRWARVWIDRDLKSQMTGISE